MVQKNWAPARYGHGGQYLFIWNNDEIQVDGIAGVRVAGMAALEFGRLFRERRSELPSGLDFKICLHTAPLQVMVNPILNQYAHEGGAMTKISTLSASLPPGAIY